MSTFTTYANDLADQQLPNGASGTFAVGSGTYTLPIRVQFCSTVCTESAIGTALGTPVSIAGAVAAAASAKQKTSTGAITLTGAPAGTWADVAFIDSSGTPKPTVYRGGTSLGKTVNAGDSLVIPAGQLVTNITNPTA